MAIGVRDVSLWSAMLLTSGANAEWVPVWAAVVTEAQPQPPGTHVATLDANVPRVPLSKPSLSGVVGAQNVAVGVSAGLTCPSLGWLLSPALVWSGGVADTLAIAPLAISPIANGTASASTIYQLYLARRASGDMGRSPFQCG